MTKTDLDLPFVGNNTALDFINTQVMRRGELIDLIQESADLTRWAQLAGRTLTGKLSEEALAGAKILRASLKELFVAQIQGTKVTKKSLVSINQHLAVHTHHELLQVDIEGGLVLVQGESASRLSALLAELAYEGAQLLASTKVSNVKCCSNPECVLLFLDTSRSRKRRWCSMETCGNRAKVAKHYRSKSR